MYKKQKKIVLSFLKHVFYNYALYDLFVYFRKNTVFLISNTNIGYTRFAVISVFL